VTELTPERCITCSDEAVEAEVVAIDGLEAVVLVAGRRERVAVDLVPETTPGDVLLCHAGVALERIGTRPARPTEVGHRAVAP
jgi:hydrogenase maturation factor